MEDTEPLRDAVRDALLSIVMAHADTYGLRVKHHLMRQFGISKPQASNDLRRYVSDNPDDVTYDVSRKCYVQK